MVRIWLFGRAQNRLVVIELYSATLTPGFDVALNSQALLCDRLVVLKKTLSDQRFSSTGDVVQVLPDENEFDGVKRQLLEPSS